MKISKKKSRFFRSVKSTMSAAQEDLIAAHDFRGQQQARATNTTTKDHRGKFLRQFPDAIIHLKNVYPDVELPDEKTIKALYDSISTHTVLDEPLLQSAMSATGKQIEKAALGLKLPLRSGVSLGGSHASELAAMQQRVMMTEASIVMVTSSFLLMLHRFSKLLALSTPTESFEADRFRTSLDLQEFKQKYYSDSKLRERWISFFTDYSINPESPPRGEAIILTGKIIPSLKEMYQEAMWTFALAHEYAHHIAEHSLGEVASASGAAEDRQQAQELEADAIGAHICMKIADSSADFEIFLISNVGACLILKVLELFRMGTALLEGAPLRTEGMRADHPALELRLQSIDEITAQVCSDELNSKLVPLRSLYLDFMDFLWSDAVTNLANLRKQGVLPVRAATRQWLP